MVLSQVYMSTTEYAGKLLEDVHKQIEQVEDRTNLITLSDRNAVVGEAKKGDTAGECGFWKLAVHHY